MDFQDPAVAHEALCIALEANPDSIEARELMLAYVARCEAHGMAETASHWRAEARRVVLEGERPRAFPPRIATLARRSPSLGPAALRSGTWSLRSGTTTASS